MGINESIADPVTVTTYAVDFANASGIAYNINHISTFLFKSGQWYEISSWILRSS